MTKNNGPEKPKKETCDVFKELEHFGRFHTLQFFLVCLPLFVFGMTITNFVFVAENIDYRCKVPECDTANSTSETPSWWPEHIDKKCLKPVLDLDMYEDNQTCSKETFTGQFEICHEWIYESNSSIVAEFDLACQSWKATLVGSIRNSAMIISMLLAGWLADKFGRKPANIVCAVGGAAGVVKVFVTNYYAYLAVEFVESFLTSGLLTVAVVLLIEIGGESKRVMTGVIFSYSMYVGEFVFALLAMVIPHWKYLILTINLPFLLFLSYGLLLRESARWQMLRGKTNEARQTFKLIARMNKLEISQEEIDNIKEKDLRMKLNVKVQKDKESVKEIVRSKIMMIRLLVTSCCFFTSALIYCGLMIHAVYLPGNKYSNFALAAVASFPGDLLAFFTFTKFGRRISLQCGYFGVSLFIVAQAFIPNDLRWLKLILYLLGKFSVVVTFTGIYTYSLELFPTSVRGSLVGFGNTTARIGSMLAPLTPMLKNEFAALPSVLFSTMACIAGLVLMLTPETKELPMFDTIEQVEAYNSNQKCSANP